MAHNLNPTNTLLCQKQRIKLISHRTNECL
jgi:hypothetical protein